MWLESPVRPGTSILDLVSRYRTSSHENGGRGGQMPTVLRVRDIQIGLNSSARQASRAGRSAATCFDSSASRGCIEGMTAYARNAEELLLNHVFLASEPLSWFCLSRVSADVWIEDHDVAVRIGETKVEIAPEEWRILHFDDMMYHRCTDCKHPYYGMRRSLLAMR
eukprot:TRINITY_DN114266_c0_g1_i1.p1 TRINITY_DN114266_c0_g1~~TRINITY_DN114266_c0_g1_i1.p1  ORF type:complete len:177 (-),score=19.44 TRINITY_DN114266_c0_g1_i1:98-595(-)